MREEIIKAKVTLYRLLLNLDNDTLTENEAEIMFDLSKDREVQSYINKISK